MAASGDRKRLESVLREPLSRHRLALNTAIRAAKNPETPKPFTIDDLKQFMRDVHGNDESLRKEAANIIVAVEGGKAPSAPKFDTPQAQLLWGAGIAYLSLNPQQMASWSDPPAEDTPVSGTALWKQVVETKAAYNELLSHAHHVREALRDKETRYSWGEPGVGFTFDRNKNHIAIDLMQSMIVGFEHARADVYREIGQSLLSVTYPQRMQAVYKEMLPLLKQSRLAQEKKGPQLKPDEYKKLRVLSAEWQLRHMMFAAAEENVANRFVSNMGQQMLQDYSVSINNTAVTFRGIGLARLPSLDQASDELIRYMNLCNTVQLSFFEKNGFFDNTDAGWKKVGVDPALVRKTATRNALSVDNGDIEHPDFKHLRELCSGPKGLENLQPQQQERLFGWQNLSTQIAKSDAERKQIIETIWKLYAEDLIQQILKQVNDEVDQQLKDAKDQQQDQDGQDQEGQEGQDQEGQDGQEGQEGQEGQGQGKGQGQGQGKGKPQKGPKDQQEQKKKQDKRGKPQGEQKDPEELDGEEGEGQGEKQEGQKKEGQDGQGEKQEKKLGADKDDTVPVEGAGDMPAPETPSEIPSDEVDPSADADGEGKDADGQDADGEAADGEDADGETIEEMEQKKDQMDQEGEEADGQDADGDDADGEGQKSKGKAKGQKKPGGKDAGKGQGKPLGELAKQDWTDYAKRVSELSGVIARVRKLFKQVQERQLQRKNKKSATLDILPENGEVKDRFNAEAHRDFTIKKVTGQVEENDLKRFHRDEPKFIPTEIDIVIMVDGSGSMNGGSPSALEMALQSAAILNESARGKDMKMNVYVGMWGDQSIPILVKPGDDPVTIGKAFQGARRGLSSGTAFAPAVKKVAEVIGEQRGKSGTLSGFTHVLVISDGDIFDQDDAKKAIGTMFQYSDKVTFDTAIITAQKGTSMQRMAETIKDRKPYQGMGIVLGKDPEEVPFKIVGLLLEKIRKCGSFVAIPNSQKRRMMNQAKNKMDKKP